MLNNLYKLFKSKGTNDYLLVVEFITLGFVNITFKENLKNKLLYVTSVSADGIDVNELTTMLTTISTITDSTKINYDSNMTLDYHQRLENFLKNPYDDMTYSINSSKFKPFSKLYNCKHGNVNIINHLLNNNIHVYEFETLEQENIVVPEQQYKYEFKVEQNYLNNNLNIQDFKFKMPRQEDYEVISEGPLFKSILSMINSPRTFSNKRNFLLLGPASGGKTEVVNALAQYLDAPYASVNCLNKMDIDSFFIVLHPTTDTSGNLKWIEKHTDLLDVIINGGIILLDEFNNLDHQTQLMWNNIIEGSKKTVFVHGKTFKVNENLIVFATGNVAYQGTKSLNTATKSRFEQIYVPTLDSSHYLKKVNKNKQMSLHIDNGNTKKFVDFLFKTKQLMDSFVSENSNIIEPPMIVSRQMDIFFDKLFVYNDFVKAFNEWIDGLFHSSSLTDDDKKAFKKPLDVEATNMNIAFKSAYISEQPIKINDKEPEPIITSSDTLDRMNELKAKLRKKV